MVRHDMELGIVDKYIVAQGLAKQAKIEGKKGVADAYALLSVQFSESAKIDSEELDLWLESIKKQDEE